MHAAPFDSVNAATPRGPVILSVPHAGRRYPDCQAMLRVPIAQLSSLEDRHADLLAANAIAEGATAIIARTPRLWIDLNRAEADLDPAMVAGTPRSPVPLSVKVRGGLGLVPRRLAGTGDIWRTPLARADLDARIATIHRPYHAALAAVLTAAHARFGAALLLDIHSMPPLRTPGAPEVVIGDRFGASAAPRLTAAAETVLAESGLRIAVNTPYAGGHIVAHHAKPASGFHAMQIEVDRALYLDRHLDGPGHGLARMQRTIARLVAALGEALLDDAQALAAE